MYKVVLLLIISLSFSTHAFAKPYPDYVIGKEIGEGEWQDITFKINKIVQQKDGSNVLFVSEGNDNINTGFTIKLSSKWKESPFGQGVNLTVYSGTVIFESSGNESDLFVKKLDEVYNVKLNALKMKDQIFFEAVSLEGNPNNILKQPAKLKLFYIPKKDDDYAEVFLNIDAESSVVELKEKDTEYRVPLVKALKK